MLKQRIITAAILAPLALYLLFGLNATYFALGSGALLLVGSWEWSRLAGMKLVGQLFYPLLCALLLWLLALQPQLLQGLIWLAASWWLAALLLVISYPASRRLWQHPAIKLLIGLLVLLPTWSGLVLLHQTGWQWLLYVLLICWVADIFAYFAGRTFGRHKLAPAVSPGKSWEGVAGGLAGTSLLAILFPWLLQLDVQLLPWLLVTWLVTGVSILGDLTESLFKREAGMKDSSQLLPGHGGILDRIDSLTAAVPLFALLLSVSQQL